MPAEFEIATSLVKDQTKGVSLRLDHRTHSEIVSAAGGVVMPSAKLCNTQKQFLPSMNIHCVYRKASGSSKSGVFPLTIKANWLTM